MFVPRSTYYGTLWGIRMTIKTVYSTTREQKELHANLNKIIAKSLYQALVDAVKYLDRFLPPPSSFSMTRCHVKPV